MKSIKFFFAPVLAGMMLVSCGEQTPVETAESEEVTEGLSGEFNLDTDGSVVNWEGNMVAIGGVSLYGHNGTIQISEGSVTLENGKITSGNVVVDMTTIRPLDDNYEDKDGRRAEDLVGHLSSDDFFNVEEHPTARLDITGMEDGKLKGDLTIRGNTNAVTIEKVNVKEGEDGTMMASGEFTIDRQKYGAKFSMANAMDVRDKILSDDIKLAFEVKGSN